MVEATSASMIADLPQAEASAPLQNAYSPDALSPAAINADSVSVLDPAAQGDWLANTNMLVGDVDKVLSKLDTSIIDGQAEAGNGPADLGFFGGSEGEGLPQTETAMKLLDKSFDGLILTNAVVQVASETGKMTNTLLRSQ